MTGDMRERLEDFVDTFVVNGARPADVLDAIVAEAAVLREAYDRDPDPANDTDDQSIGEPSNDWPADEKDQSHSGDI